MENLNGKNMAEEFKKRRENFMSTYENDPILSTEIPEIVMRLCYDEMGYNLIDKSHVAIIFVTAWTEILKFVKKQPSDEFAINVCGISMEYTTEYSESDKIRNVVPQMIHKFLPKFESKQHQLIVGAAEGNNKILDECNRWRSEHKFEIIDKLERDVREIVKREYGFDIYIQQIVIPTIAAAYVAGVQLARSRKKSINMYNVFQITVASGDQIILTPMSTVKQYIKSDSEKM